MSRNITWTKEKTALLISEYSTADLTALSIEIGISYAALKSRATVLHLKRSDSVRKWNQSKRDRVRELYPCMKNIDIAKELGLKESSVAALAFKMKLRKDPAFLKECCSKGYFNPGQIPVNKGLKQVDYMSPDMIKRTMATRFKPGHRPLNSMPVGGETDKTKGGYIKVKIAEPNVWRYKQRLIWEAANGPIPKGYNVQFKDGNRKNCDISNLYIISKHNQVNQNSIHRYPAEIKSAIMAAARLKKAIKRYFIPINQFTSSNHN